MAYTMKSGKMISNQIDSYLANAIAEVAVKDGALVKLGNLVADTTYTATGVEYDTYAAAAPAAVTDEIVIVDYAGISEGTINGNEYKLGNKLYDLEIPAGEIFRVRRLALHDKFWLGESNFATTPTVGAYAGIKANDMKHAALTEIPANGYAVKVLLAEDLTTGMRNNGKLYLCEVVQL